MTCGALVFLHLGKTGGSSVARYLEEAAPRANFSFHSVWWGMDGSWNHDIASQYNFTQDPEWVNFSNAMYTQAQPKSAIQLHHGVPGVSQYLWAAELLPMKRMLEAKGCELRLMTVLRSGTDRAISEFNFMKESGFKFYNAFFACRDVIKMEMTDACACDVADAHANMQVTELAFGHLDEDSVFSTAVGAVSEARAGSKCHSACQVRPLRFLGNGEESTNANWTKKTIEFLEETSYLVGCTETLDGFAGALAKMLGVSKGEMPRDRHTNASLELSTPARKSCISKANIADNAVHAHFCVAG